MAKPKLQSLSYECGGHKLTVRILNGKRYFECASWPDIATRFDGCADATEALDEFERRAAAGAAAPVTTEG